jgi:hypothetical protein
MRVALIVASALHAILAIVLLVMPDSKLTLTMRHQFDDWTPLLSLYRSAPSNITEEGAVMLREKALEIAWCAAYLPLGTQRAPYCVCLEKQSNIFISNVTSRQDPITSVERDAVIRGLVACLSTRPVWRVLPIWGVQFGTPAVYALFITSCFLWVAAGLSRRWTSIPVWAFSISVSIVLIAESPLNNGLWVFTVMLVALLIEWVLYPGMKPHPSPGNVGHMLLDNPNNAVVERIPSSFWWCEYLCAPVFAVYIPLMHCGRDIVFTSVVAMLGTAIGGLGLRSYWCAQAYCDAPKNQFRSTMQCIVWLGILASSISILSMAAIYYRDNPHYAMGSGSVVLLCLTVVIGLLQWPHAQGMSWILLAQATVAFVRNVLLFVLVIYDMKGST